MSGPSVPAPHRSGTPISTPPDPLPTLHTTNWLRMSLRTDRRLCPSSPYRMSGLAPPAVSEEQWPDTFRYGLSSFFVQGYDFPQGAPTVSAHCDCGIELCDHTCSSTSYRTIPFSLTNHVPLLPYTHRHRSIAGRRTSEAHSSSVSRPDRWRIGLASPTLHFAVPFRHHNP